MSGETESNVSGWTTDTLHQYVQRMAADQSALFAEVSSHHASQSEVALLMARVEAIAELMESKFVTFRVLVESQAEKVALALTASKEAIDKAEVATAKAIDKAELATSNRFAAGDAALKVISDQQRTLITRVEVAAAIERNTERIHEVSTRLDRAERGD